MKKNYIPILLAFAAYCGNSAAAQDVYVYKGEGLDPVSTLKNVQRITFADAQIEFLLDNGESTNFSLDQLDYFTFFDRKDASVGIADVTTDKNVNVSCDGDIVTVESVGKISGVEIFSVEGIKMADVKPDGNYAKYSLAPYANGIYLVRVIVDGKAVTQKIIKK